MNPSFERPAPTVTPESADYWQAAAEGRLMLGRSTADGRLHHPPQRVCPFTWAPAEQVEAAGTGTVSSFTIVHQSSVPAFRARVPYVVAYVELDEGPSMISNIEDCAPSEVHVGMRVWARFCRLSEAVGVPVFVPAGKGPGDVSG